MDRLPRTLYGVNQGLGDGHLQFHLDAPAQEALQLLHALILGVAAVGAALGMGLASTAPKAWR